ncbi:MAG TPA: DUF4388 domain-containing protein [Thermoanaerobaculia bacterium]|nr:DUF4388 domain-containing protein [Thermoanaerobaculia bacterium]
MSLAGKLEDVPLADVMQFIHLGRRTGTLSLQRGVEQGEITFHHGAIVGARSPASRKIGELLLEEGILDRSGLERALRLQEEESPDRTLGQILLHHGDVPMDAVRDAVRGQIEKTIYELVTWAHGSFVFELDTLKPVDDIAVFPGDLLPDIDLNTQMVLLEAARIFDERNRAEDDDGRLGPSVDHRNLERRSAAELFAAERAGALRTAPAPAPPPAAEVTSIRLPEETAPAESEPPQAPPLELVEPVDPVLAAHLEDSLAELGVEVRRVPASEAGQHGPGEPSPVVVFELRRDDDSARELLTICRSRPGLPVICVLDEVTLTAKAYEAGAAAAVPRDPDAVLGCYQSISRFRGMIVRPAAGEPAARTAFAKLRRVVYDLRSGVFSATVALNLMNIIAESVERAVLFLVKRESLTALGAFGFNAAERPLAEATRGLHVPLEEGSAFTEAIRAGRALSVSFDEAGIPDGLRQVLGPPRTGQVVLFPVLGSDRVILLIYTDNGELDRPIEEIDIIDLAAAEVGIAFENEMLRRQLSNKRG